MAPNLYILLRNIFVPSCWRLPSHSRRGSRDAPKKAHIVHEHWDFPVPGTYEYRPGRGWFLIQLDLDQPGAKGQPFEKPQQVVYCNVLERWMFLSDYKARCHWERVMMPNARKYDDPCHMRFLRLDDSVGYLMCWDEDGKPLDGPWMLWEMDEKKKKLRYAGTISSRSLVGKRLSSESTLTTGR
ncbi:MAG: hypothetical protein M1834_008996 [Cirrosporium novae-zelandiae]|nr:MAG: hypothetical protein M1834_008996 [Cirrosporium novae-zelandiae]